MSRVAQDILIGLIILGCMAFVGLMILGPVALLASGRALFGVLAFLPLLLLISYAIGSAVKS